MAAWLWSVRPEHFPVFVRTGTFALRQQGRSALRAIRPGDRLFAYLSGSRVLAGVFEAAGAAFEDATALVPGGPYPHRLRVRPVTVLSEEAWIPYQAFADKLAVLNDYGEQATPDLRFRAVVQRVVHALPKVDEAVLDFLIRTRAETDPERLIALAEQYKAAREEAKTGERNVAEPALPYASAADLDRGAAVERLIAATEARGFVYEPWEIAAFVTALRTKPLVLLAGVTGVGKSRLPHLVAEATGGAATLIPVRPDWTDPAEVLGYTDLTGAFRPGVLLQVARTAAEGSARLHIAVLDEMNQARPEHYLAEVLSRLEARTPAPGGGWESPPLLTQPLAPADAAWQRVGLPPTFALVGTVNVDESGYAFSRKVLDRAFTLELTATALAEWRVAASDVPEPDPWPAAAWWPRALRLGGLGELTRAEEHFVQAAVSAIAEADALLAPAGLGVGYRSRDEAALFTLHAADLPEAFRTRGGAAVAPLDLALLMKLLPRLEGSRPSVRAAVLALFGWAFDGAPRHDEAETAPLLAAWEAEGRPDALGAARFPRTAARLARMTDTLLADGYVSFWG